MQRSGSTQGLEYTETQVCFPMFREATERALQAPLESAARRSTKGTTHACHDAL